MNYNELTRSELIALQHSPNAKDKIEAEKALERRMVRRRQEFKKAMLIQTPAGKGRNAFHQHLRIVKTIDEGLPISRWTEVQLTDEEKTAALTQWRKYNKIS